VSLAKPVKIASSQLLLPLAGECVSAGFPSPADDYIDIGIDLNEELIHHPASTFFLRVKGISMTNAGIQDGDLLIVDRSLEARPGRIVVAVLDGNFTLKRLAYKEGALHLHSEHPDYPPVNTNDYDSIQVWGVAIYSIHSLGSAT
tara:strand:- start:57 stop:491 length:435 start_codon:yes stop_codon:yes gene_type:complete